LKRRALFDPLLDLLLLGRRQGLVRLRRGHDLVLVVGDDAQPDLALRQIAGHDRDGAAFALLVQPVGRIQAHFGLALPGIDPVTGEAIVRQNGPDVAVELDGFRRAGRRLAARQENENGGGKESVLDTRREWRAGSHGRKAAQSDAQGIATLSNIEPDHLLRKYVTRRR
jgi:hypothetical protein